MAIINAFFGGEGGRGGFYQHTHVDLVSIPEWMVLSVILGYCTRVQGTVPILPLTVVHMSIISLHPFYLQHQSLYCHSTIPTFVIALSVEARTTE